ncbi:MAG: hypothetical protein ACXW1Z_20730 [Methylobacter sp.]
MSLPQMYNNKPLVHSWEYRATDGAPLGQVARYQNGSDKKDIVPFFKPNGSGWTVGIGLSPRPLFGLDRLASHDKNKAIFLVEGEKSAAALHGLGICAITSIGGAQAAKQADWKPLNGFKAAYILPDADHQPGERYAQDVYGALMALSEPPAVKGIALGWIARRRGRD